MTDSSAEVARVDQRAAESRNAVIDIEGHYARSAADLRADIAAGRATRSEAISSLVSHSRGGLTEYGAATILDRAGVPGRFIRKTNGVAGLPPLITTEDN